MKTANDPLAQLRSSLQAQLSQQLQRDALNTALTIGGTAFGAGMALRGANGLMQLLRRNTRKPIRSIPAPTRLEIPVEEVEPKIAKVHPLCSVGQEDDPKFMAYYRRLLERRPDLTGQKEAGVLDFVTQQAGNAATGLKNLSQGQYARTMHGVPWSGPAWLAAGVGGGLAGYKLTDYLLDKRRKAQQQEELAEARRQYEMALSKQGELGIELQGLWEDLQSVHTKVANLTPGELAGRGMSVYLAAALLAGGLGAYSGYQFGKKRQLATVLDKAQKLRRRQRYEQQPSPVYAVPVPIPRPQPAPQTLETPEVPKLAAIAVPGPGTGGGSWGGLGRSFLSGVANPLGAAVGFGQQLGKNLSQLGRGNTQLGTVGSFASGALQPFRGLVNPIAGGQNLGKQLNMAARPYAQTARAPFQSGSMAGWTGGGGGETAAASPAAASQP